MVFYYVGTVPQIVNELLLYNILLRLRGDKPSKSDLEKKEEPTSDHIGQLGYYLGLQTDKLNFLHNQWMSWLN